MLRISQRVSSGYLLLRIVQGIDPTRRVDAKFERADGKMAARLGLEPRQAESESAVLPLHHQAVEIETLRRHSGGSGAGDGSRTCNHLFTKQVLCH